MKKQKISRTVLQMVPQKRAGISWREEQSGLVVVKMEHHGFYAKIAQVCFHKPRVSNIKMDEFGSYIWKQIDGTRNLQEIALLLKKRFGQEAEPLYDRFISFIRILSHYGFVQWRGEARHVG